MHFINQKNKPREIVEEDVMLMASKTGAVVQMRIGEQTNLTKSKKWIALYVFLGAWVRCTPISENVVGRRSGICDRKELWEARKAPFFRLKIESIVYRCLYICILTCCELQTGKQFTFFQFWMKSLKSTVPFGHRFQIADRRFLK